MRRTFDRSSGAAQGRLKARTRNTPNRLLGTGVHTLKVPGTRDALLYVPDTADQNSRLPLMVSLHGAGGDARNGMEMLLAGAGKHAFAVLAPASRGSTWDAIGGGFGPDVTAIDDSLSRALDDLPVRPEAVAISGFSDGASYALSIGLANGDLFHYIVAFSPGFMAPPAQHDSPRIFVSHGMRDSVLPIERCSRTIVPRLRRAGYEVQYREFDGPHTVPESVKEEAFEWWYSDLRDG